MNFEFDSVESVLEDVRNGRLIIVTDDENRENERLKRYLEQSGISANSYIKGLIKADLDSKGIPYPDSQDNA